MTASSKVNNGFYYKSGILDEKCRGAGRTGQGNAEAGIMTGMTKGGGL
jgi:hypothetical protein